MNKKKTPNELRIRSSAAEFLTFSYQTGGDGVEVRVQDGTVWLTQRAMGRLFDTSSDNIGLHLKNIYAEGELSESATAEEFSVVQKEGGRNVNRVIAHYSLDTIRRPSWQTWGASSAPTSNLPKAAPNAVSR